MGVRTCNLFRGKNFHSNTIYIPLFENSTESRGIVCKANDADSGFVHHVRAREEAPPPETKQKTDLGADGNFG